MTSTNASPGTPAGLQWNFNVSQASPGVSYVTVYDSNATGNAITPTNCTDGGNNTNWGFVVIPTLSFSVNNPTITFDNLNPPNDWSSFKTGTITTSTNAGSGYNVKAYVTQLLTSLAYPDKKIVKFEGGSYALPAGWPSGQCTSLVNCGFGYHSSDPSIAGVDKFNANPCPGGGTPPCYAPFTQDLPGEIVADSTGPVNGEEVTFTYKVAVTANQTASTYQTYVIYIVTANY